MEINTLEQLIRDNIISALGELEAKIISQVKEQHENNNVVEEVKPVELGEKENYINNAEMGTLVAFKTDTGKVKSAKLINRSVIGRRLKLETEYGMQYIISYDDVLWVRTGWRWPNGVYKLLKGIKDENTENIEIESEAASNE